MAAPHPSTNPVLHGAGRRLFDFRALLLIVSGVFVLCVIAYPLVQVFWRSIVVDGELSLANYARVFLTPRNYIALWNSVWTALAATALATVLGTLAAFVVERTDIPFRSGFRFLFMLPFAIPPLFAAMGWVQLLGPVGLVSRALQSLFDWPAVPWSIYGPGGIIFVLAVTVYPFVFLTVAGALQRMDSSLEEAARTAGVGPFRIMKDITLPLVLPAILGGALLAFVGAIDNFGVPAVLGMRRRFYVLTTRIYEALTIPDIPLATAMSILLVLLAVTALALLRLLEGSSGRYTVVSGKSVRPHIIRLGRARPYVFAATLLVMVVVVVMPLVALVITSLLPYWGAPLDPELVTLRNYERAFAQEGAKRGIVNSLLLAPTAATILVAVGTLISYLNVKGKMRAAVFLDALGTVPYALPGSVIGIAMILAWSNPPLGPPLYGTIWILLMAYLMRYLSYALRSTRATLHQIHDSLEEAAVTAGASTLRVLRDITIPLLKPGMIAGWVLIFMPAFRGLTVSVLIWSAGAETLGVWVFLLQDSGFPERASALAVATLPLIILLYVVAHRMGWGSERARS